MDTPSFQQTHKMIFGTDFDKDKPPNIYSLHTPYLAYGVSTKKQHARKPSHEEEAEFRAQKPISSLFQPPPSPPSQDLRLGPRVEGHVHFIPHLPKRLEKRESSLVNLPKDDRR
ncbi:hypothetical protein PspLS_03106 [Pyricularia sp. CBS 133598]|nr:hypothetical protein PspLS_03106 [Pyricularia sp. CBS 133598]